MGFDYKGSASDPNIHTKSDTTQISSENQNDPHQSRMINNLPAEEVEPKYQEHVSRPLKVPPVAAAQPMYQPQQPVQPRNQGTAQPAPTPYYQPVPQQPSRQQYPQQYAQPRQPYPQQYAQPGPPSGQLYPQQYAQPGQSYPQQYGQPSGQPYGYGSQQQPYYPGYAYGPYYSNYAPGYYGHPPYGYPPYGYYGWTAPIQPKRDVYQLTIAIITLVCSCIALFIGFLCPIFLLLTMVGNNGTIHPEDMLSAVTLLTALTISGIGGGSFGLYHSIRALLKKKSLEFKVPSIRLSTFRLPWFVIFLALYIVMIAIGLMVRGNTQIVGMTGLTVLMIELAGLLPALTILTLGVWRTHKTGDTHWPTTWRRISVALITGATSAILFAMILEFVLGGAIQKILQISSDPLSDANAPLPSDISGLIYLFLIVSVLAPLVEESVKPLAVVTMIGRVGSAGEAFIMGLACGIGFDLIETSGYIGMGYSNWVDVAIQRSSAGLLHGFGAGMTALGWYILTHRKSVPKHHILIGLGCGLYAILQHGIWNGSFLFEKLPAPIGPYFDTGVITIGTYQLPAALSIYAVETILMLIFFLFITGKLSGKGTLWWRPQPTIPETSMQGTEEAARPPVSVR